MELYHFYPLFGTPHATIQAINLPVGRNEFYLPEETESKPTKGTIKINLYEYISLLTIVDTDRT